jgi:outer membrane receptor protein involved in Fe transport
LVQAFAASAAPLALALATPAVAQTGAGEPAPQPDATVSAVTVTASRPAVETSIDRRSYSLANDLFAQTGSLADALRNIPAVQVDAQGNPSLRGDPNITILVDGRPSAQFSGQNLGQALQSMPADQIERIEVMTSPPAEFRARGSGGVINLVTRKTKTLGRTGSVRLTAGDHERAGVNLSLGYTAGRFSASGDAAYRHIERSQFDVQVEAAPLSQTAPGEKDSAAQHWTYDNWQAHGSLDYNPDGQTRITGQGRYNARRYATLYDDLFVARDAFGDPDSSLNRLGREHDLTVISDASLTWRRTPAEGRSLTLYAAYRGYDEGYRRRDLSTQTFPAAAVSSQFRTWTDHSPRTTLAADVERRAFGGTLKLGYDFEYAPKRTDQAAGSGPADGPIAFDPEQQGVFLDTETLRQAYASYERRVGKFTVQAGARTEDLRLEVELVGRGPPIVHDYPRLFPNLHLAYDLGEGRKWTASYTRRINAPYSEQLDPLPLTLSPLQLTAGDPNLRPEDAHAYELAYETSRGRRSTTTTLFYRETRDAFTIVATRLPSGVMLQTTVNASAVRRLGGEWAISGKLTPKLTYSVSIDIYRIEISAADLVGLSSRSATTGFGRASLSYQITPKDLLQLDAYSNGKRLRPQGYAAASYSGAIGYRHTINSKISWLLAIEDPFQSQRYRSVDVIDGVRVQHQMKQSSRLISVAIVWNLAGKPKDADFDFGAGGDR